MNNMVEFTKRLRRKREEANFTQAQLAAIVGVSTQTISAYERTGEKGKTPTLDNAAKIAQALGVSLDWLIGQEQQTEIPSELTAYDLAILFDKIQDSGLGMFNATGNGRVEAAIFYKELAQYYYVKRALKERGINAILPPEAIDITINAQLDNLKKIKLHFPIR